MNNTLTCPECQNVVTLEQEVRVGDIVECPHCGSELRIADMNDAGISVTVIEEEK